MNMYPMQELFPSCPACLTSLADHLRIIAAERDQTKLSGLLLNVLKDTLLTRRSALYRYVARKEDPFVILFGEIASGVMTTHDAYLLSPSRGTNIEQNSRLARCINGGKPILEVVGGCHVCIFPIYRRESLHLLVELERDVTFDQATLSLVESILTYYSDHLALIDYAETDTLTGLLNRKTFDEHLDRVLSTASDDTDIAATGDHPLRRHVKPTDQVSNWLAIIDIDHFKRVNDSHGHLIGDEVLLLIAQRMQESFRLDDQLFRYGGEEFVTVLQPTGLSEARVVLDRFRRTVEEYQFPMVGKITVSVGFTRISYFDNPPDLVDRADKALYFAKEHGRNKVESYEELNDRGLLGTEHARLKSDVELF